LSALGNALILPGAVAATPPKLRRILKHCDKYREQIDSGKHKISQKVEASVRKEYAAGPSDTSEGNAIAIRIPLNKNLQEVCGV
jgi:hypothetical protein